MNMREPSTVWERAPTDAEITAFYGREPDGVEVAIAIERHANALDKDDLTEVCHEFAVQILDAVKTNNAYALMDIFRNELKATVARSASLALYEDAWRLKASEVTL